MLQNVLTVILSCHFHAFKGTVKIGRRFSSIREDFFGFANRDLLLFILYSWLSNDIIFIVKFYREY